MKSNLKDLEFWSTKPEVSDEIFKHAEEFISQNSNKYKELELSENSLKKNIDKIISDLSQKDRTLPEVRAFESGLLSYIYAVFCKTYNGRCFGSFSKKNSGAATYSLRFCTKKNVYDLAIPFSYAINGRSVFSVFIDEFKNELPN